jgi:hypothetical protein
MAGTSVRLPRSRTTRRRQCCSPSSFGAARKRPQTSQSPFYTRCSNGLATDGCCGPLWRQVANHWHVSTSALSRSLSSPGARRRPGYRSASIRRAHGTTSRADRRDRPTRRARRCASSRGHGTKARAELRPRAVRVPSVSERRCKIEVGCVSGAAERRCEAPRLLALQLYARD